jgi:peptide deformylase
MTDFIYNSEASLASTVPNDQLRPYQLVAQNDTILKQHTKPFDFGSVDLDPVLIATRLIETAKYHNSFCIAANQCGLPYNVFVCGHGEEYVAYFNSSIILYDDEEITIPEVDLSNMGLLLSVKRPKSIFIQYQDYEGLTKSVRLYGLTARIVQQCFDRVNGVDFKTRVSKFVLDRAKKSLNKRVKKFVRSNVIIKK